MMTDPKPPKRPFMQGTQFWTVFWLTVAISDAGYSGRDVGAFHLVDVLFGAFALYMGVSNMIWQRTGKSGRYLK